MAREAGTIFYKCAYNYFEEFQFKCKIDFQRTSSSFEVVQIWLLITIITKYYNTNVTWQVLIKNAGAFFDSTEVTNLISFYWGHFWYSYIPVF